MLFVVIKYQNISLLSTPGLLWLEETLEDVAKEALISLCFCPKLESLIVLSYIQEVIYLGGKKGTILPITTVQEVRAEHRASGLNQRTQKRRGSQSHSIPHSSLEIK